jgi:putative ABC transport system permease protein
MSFRLTDLLRDLVPAGRALRRRPLYFASSTLVLAAGLAATLAVFVVVRATQLEPLPFPEPGRLVAFEAKSSQGHLVSVSIPNFYDWKNRTTSFDRFAASAGWSLNLRSAEAGAEVLSSRAVLGEFFEALGLQTQLGRGLTAPDNEKGSARVVVLSDGLWRRRFAADPQIVGKVLDLQGQPHTVLGVLAPGEGYPSPDVETYFPMGSDADNLPWTNRGSSFGTQIVARLKPGIELAAANAELKQVTENLVKELGMTVATPRALPLADRFVGDRRNADRLISALVACFFAIAAGNALLLALARGEERRAELAVRTALGATVAANRRILLAEALWVGGIAAALGIAGAAWLLRASWLRDAVPALLVGRLTIRGLDVAVAAGLVAIAIATLTWAPKVNGEAKVPVRGHGRRGRTFLVAAEVALTLALVSLAALLTQSALKVAGVERGFATADVLTLRVGRSSPFPDAGSWRGAWDRVLDESRRLPGVTDSAATLLVPLAQRSWEMRVQPSDRPWLPDNGDSMLFNVVSENYFEALSVPLLRGRIFSAADRDGSPMVAIVDETLAQKYWPGQDPIGKQIHLEQPNSNRGEKPPEVRTVVGVTKNVRHYELESASRIQVYVPWRQTGERFGLSLYLALRLDPARTVAQGDLERMVRDTLRRVDPDLAPSDVATMETRFDDALAGRKALSRWSTLFGSLSLGLALAGVFALTAHAVTRRARELAVRAAMGARRDQLVRLVLRRSLQEAVWGAVVGIGLALAAAPLARSLFYGVGPFDVSGVGTAVALVTAGTLLAAAVPAIRAARAEPTKALRDETIRN